MKFNSKAHLAKELIAGKQFADDIEVVVYYDEKLPNPFRYGSNEMRGIWDDHSKDIWTEVQPRHIHQDLIDSYKEGQAWQYRDNSDANWRDLSNCLASWEPSWKKDTQYRLHPHNDLIQEHRKGATIQSYVRGEWEEEPNPDWSEDTQYRIKPRHIHQDLIDSYKEGQAWQFSLPSMGGAYMDVVAQGEWIEPAWDENTTYRLHPHNAIIQEHCKGTPIQAYICGDWIEEPLPDWYNDTQYRVKPTTETLYEWIFKTKYKSNWMVESFLLSEEEAKHHFDKHEYRKTGRSWEVE
jgi:hypothetical protein